MAHLLFRFRERGTDNLELNLAEHDADQVCAWNDDPNAGDGFMDVPDGDDPGRTVRVWRHSIQTLVRT